MTKNVRLDQFSEEERLLLIEALCALRFVRGQEWNKACDLAEIKGEKQPSLNQFQITKIQKLAVKLGGKAAHWTELCYPIKKIDNE